MFRFSPSPLFLSLVKTISLFVAGLYLIGFVWFPFFGVGNYQLVRVDFLLPSEWVLITILGSGLIAWAFKLYFRVAKTLLEKKENVNKEI